MDIFALLPWVIISFFAAAFILLIRDYIRIRKKLLEKDSQKKSLSTLYGRITEQFFPLMKDYPYNPQNFRFIGSPIDGVQFTEDKIIFCEFKLHKSQLSPLQKRIRELVKKKKVEWAEFRFSI